MPQATEIWFTTRAGKQVPVSFDEPPSPAELKRVQAQLDASGGGKSPQAIVSDVFGVKPAVKPRPKATTIMGIASERAAERKAWEARIASDRARRQEQERREGVRRSIEVGERLAEADQYGYSRADVNPPGLSASKRVPTGGFYGKAEERVGASFAEKADLVKKGFVSLLGTGIATATGGLPAGILSALVPVEDAEGLAVDTTIGAAFPGLGALKRLLTKGKALSSGGRSMNELMAPVTTAGRVKPRIRVRAEGREFVPPQAVAPKPTAGQGVSHARVDQLRKDLGWEPRKTAYGDTKTDAELFERAKGLKGKEAGIAEKVHASEHVTLSDEETLALGSRLKELKEELRLARAAKNGEMYDIADAEAQRIAGALDESGSRQGSHFRARRFIAQDELDGWTLERGAVKANMDVPLAGRKAKKLQKQVEELETANADLVKERDAAKQQFELLLEANRSKRSRGPMTPAQKQTSALVSLRKLGVPVRDDIGKAKAVATGRGRPGKEAGFIDFGAEGVTEKVATEIRTLVRSYADEGASDWGGVLERLQRDLPGIEEDQALFILSGKYKVAKIEADIAAKKSRAFMSAIKKDAEYRMKPIAARAAALGWDLLNTTGRSLQTTLDNSLSLIQGKNVLMWKPGTWFKSVGTSLKAITTRIKDPIRFAREELALIENDPLYARAVRAKLGLSDVDGAFSKQEEFFAGALENKLPGLSHSKAMATVLMNKMRFDLFRKMAAQAPKGAPAEYFEDIARQINIATGKGHGRIAEELGGRTAGYFAYAPRYYVSKWQHNLMQPLWSAKTGAGRKQALKMYGSQLAFYGATLKAAQLFGFEVDLDPRSATFGRATAKDGSYSADLFNQQSEPLRVGAQLVYGRISKKGKYTAPGDYGDYGVGDYVESKLSAGARTIKTALTGKTIDEETGEARVARPEDFWRAYIPLSIKEMGKNRGKPGTWPASFLGAGIDKPAAVKARRSNAPPLKLWPPPGLERIQKGK